MAEPTNNLLIGVLGLAAVICGVALANRRRIGVADPYADRQLIRKGLDKPTIWIYYNDSDVNSRQWLDFGARSSRVLNIPFLNLCYESILKHNSNKYKVEVIGGLTGLKERLGEAALPWPLRNQKLVVNQPELDFIRAAVLAKYGGLWLSPNMICRGGFGELPEDKPVFFGTDLDDTFSGPDGTRVPGFRAVWSPKSGHPVFEDMAVAAFERLEAAGGGAQIRNDAKWDFLQFAAAHSEMRAGAELGRKGRDGKRIQLEDFLAAGGEGVLPFAVPAETVYIPFPMDEALRRSAFSWFVRMSEEQIMESDLAVSRLLKDALGRV